MKRIGLFFFAVCMLCMAFAMGVFAGEIHTEAKGVQDITAAIEKAQKGDTVYVRLASDLELEQTVLIDKGITVSIEFNGYTISYNGSAGKDTTTAAFHLSDKIGRAHV